MLCRSFEAQSGSVLNAKQSSRSVQRPERHHTQSSRFVHGTKPTAAAHSELSARYNALSGSTLRRSVHDATLSAAPHSEHGTKPTAAAHSELMLCARYNALGGSILRAVLRARYEAPAAAHSELTLCTRHEAHCGSALELTLCARYAAHSGSTLRTHTLRRRLRPLRHDTRPIVALPPELTL